MAEQWSRRRFLQTGALAGGGLILSGTKGFARTTQANDKLNIAVVGVAGRGGDNLNGVASQNIVALCDIDDQRLGGAAQRFPSAKTYNDFRKMLEQPGIDAVVVSTPDHTHAPVAIAAMKAGHHVYCEKPLAHTVYEIRALSDTARKLKRVTQMGTQIHAEPNYHRVVEVLQSGAIGAVSEVHVWCDKVWSGMGRKVETPPVPDYIHWDLWLGPAPERPYSPAYHPASWRGWWAFGGGTLSDMACHYMDLAHWALDLRHPSTVSAEGPEPDSEIAPEWLIVRYAYPARTGGGKQTAPVKLTWYDGGKRPPLQVEKGLPQWGAGLLFVGDKGMMMADYGRYVLFPEADFKDYTPPPKTIPDSIGHHNEWIQACKTGGPTTCNFDYSGALAEAVQLGNVAYRTGKTLEWDPKSLKAANCPEADAYIRPHYRKGWKL
jgi:predicted dehydrogenase